VGHYFLRADDPAKTAEVTTIVRRLRRMGVSASRLYLAVASLRLQARTAFRDERDAAGRHARLIERAGIDPVAVVLP
jgi:hypothetical protein